MKHRLTLSLGFAAVCLAANLHAQTPAAPSTDKEKLSYAIGLNVAKNFKTQGLDIDPQYFAAAVKDALTGGTPLMSDEQVGETMKSFQQAFMAKRQEQMAAMKATGEKSKQEGEAFLATNKAKDGVKTLPDGLEYKVVKEGTGPMPKDTDTVSVQYRGTLVNGTEFDSSFKTGKPATFPVNGVIPGWTEALKMMKVGSKWQLFIPPALAYGERGSPPVIAPNSTLIFEVELLSIDKNS